MFLADHSEATNSGWPTATSTFPIRSPVDSRHKATPPLAIDGDRELARPDVGVREKATHRRLPLGSVAIHLQCHDLLDIGGGRLTHVDAVDPRAGDVAVLTFHGPEASESTWSRSVGHDLGVDERGESQMERTAVNPWQWSVAFGFNQGEIVEGHTRTLFCAGQTSVDGEGQPQHAGDMGKQVALAVERTWRPS